MAERGYNLADLDYVIDILRHGDTLPSRYRNHKLKGDKKGYLECHIAFDWVLVYQYNNRAKEVILYAIDTGTHGEEVLRRMHVQGASSRGLVPGMVFGGAVEAYKRTIQVP